MNNPRNWKIGFIIWFVFCCLVIAPIMAKNRAETISTLQQRFPNDKITQEKYEKYTEQYNNLNVAWMFLIVFGVPLSVFLMYCQFSGSKAADTLPPPFS